MRSGQSTNTICALALVVGLLGMTTFICTGVFINIQYQTMGNVIIRQNTFLLIALLFMVFASLLQGGFYKIRTGGIALGFALWGLFALYSQEIFYRDSGYNGRTFAYVIPLLLIGLSAIQRPSRSKISRGALVAVAGGVLALIIVGIVQWRTNTPLVWTGKQGVWFPWVWQVYDPASNSIHVRAFSYFYTPLQYGVFCATGAFASLGLYFRSKSVWLLGFCAVALAGLYASGNRTALVGALIGLAIMLLSVRWPKIIGALPGLATALYLGVSGFLLIPQTLLSSQLASFNSSGIVLLNPRNLLIRLDDFPQIIAQFTSDSYQLIFGVHKITKFLIAKGARADGSNFLPIDNEVLFLALQFGLPGVLFMAALIYSLVRWAGREWQLQENPYMLALMALVFSWAVGAGFNVTYIYAFTPLCILILLSKFRVERTTSG